MWTWADSRLSGSKKNKFLTLVLAKSRKRGIHIGYTAQYFKSIDIRIRNVTDFLAFPQLNAPETFCRLYVYSNPSMQMVKLYRFKTAEIFPLYDTSEEVEEFDL